MNNTAKEIKQGQLQEGPRITREKATVRHMIRIYCRAMHPERTRVGPTTSGKMGDGTDYGLCEECLELQRYALKRLSFCRFGENKSTCVSCPVHCYGPKQRDQIKQVMRYAGPRMLWSHPVLTIRHLLDGRASK